MVSTIERHLQSLDTYKKSDKISNQLTNTVTVNKIMAEIEESTTTEMYQSETLCTSNSDKFKDLKGISSIDQIG